MCMAVVSRMYPRSHGYVADEGGSGSSYRAAAQKSVETDKGGDQYRAKRRRTKPIWFETLTIWPQGLSIDTFGAANGKRSQIEPPLAP